MNTMKKSISIILSLLMVMSCFTGLTFTAGAAEILYSGDCGTDAHWKITDDGVLTIYGTGAMNDYTAAGLRAAPYGSYASSITGLVIEEGITHIGNNAFYTDQSGNNIFQTITGSLVIPNSVESIGTKAFYRCKGFTGTLTLGNSLKTIGDYAFQQCTFTGSLSIPDSVETIGMSAFNYCQNFNGTLTLGNSVQNIGASAFYYDSGFVGNLTIPDSVITIGDSAFYKCTGFTGSLTLGNSLETIGGSAFAGDNTNNMNFTGDLVISDSVVSIGGSAFYCNTKLDSLTLNNSLTEIAAQTFYKCGFKGSLVIPDSVVNIGNDAFAYCENFTGTLTLSNSLQTIGKEAFYYSSFVGDITIPNSVTSIGEKAFAQCKGFDGNIIIGESVETIGNSAFNFCNHLTGKLIINSLNTTVGTCAFHGCASLSYGQEYAKYLLPFFEDYPDYITKTEFNRTNPTPTSDGFVTYQVKCADCNSGGWYAKETLYYIPVVSVDTNDEANEYDRIDLDLGDSSQILIVDVKPDNATDDSIAFESSDTNVVDVDQTGLLTPVSDGNATITLTADQGLTRLRSFNVRVGNAPILVSSITATPNPVEVGTGATQQLTVTVEPSDAANQSVTYSSDDTSVATVSETGLVTGITNGTANITITAADGSGVSTTVPVTVIEVPHITDFTFDPNPVTIYVGDIIPVDFYSVTPDNAVNKFIIQWGGSPLSMPQVVEVTAAYSDVLGSNITAIKGLQDGHATLAYYAADDTNGYISHTLDVTVIDPEVTQRGQCGDDVWWYIKNDELHIYGTGPMWDFGSGESHGTPSYYAYKSSFHKVVFTGNVTTIGKSAFDSFTNLSGSLVLPSTLTSIGSNAFYGCKNLTGSLVIPDNVTTIYGNAFKNCTGFNGTLTLGNSLETIYREAFGGCKNFTGALVCPDSLRDIYTDAFISCSGFTSLTLNEGLIRIYDGAFAGCKGFTGALVIPNTVLTIGAQAFNNAPNFTSLTLGNSVQKIGDSAFARYNDIPKFTGALVIPDSVTTIGAGAFKGCSKFTSLTLGNSVETIGARAFGSLYDDDTVGNAGLYKMGFTGPLVIPDSVKTISYDAFRDCRYFSSLTIGNSVETIGSNAFRNISVSGKLSIPASVTAIGDCAFHNAGHPVETFFEDYPEYYEYGTDTYGDHSIIHHILCSSCHSEVETVSEPYVPTITGITVSPERIVLVAGGNEAEITVTPVPADAENVFKFTSDTSAVYMRGNTVVSNYQAGTATVTVSSVVDPSITATVEVIVVGLDVHTDKSNLRVGETTPLTVTTTLPDEVSVIDYTVVISDGSVLAFENGEFTAQANGYTSATITATVQQGADTYELTGTLYFSVGNYIQDIGGIPETIRIKSGESYTLNPQITPADADYQTLRYESGESNIAEVNGSGKITGNTPGTTTITVSSQDGSNITKTVTVEVYNPATDIAVTKSFGENTKWIGISENKTYLCNSDGSHYVVNSNPFVTGGTYNMVLDFGSGMTYELTFTVPETPDASYDSIEHEGNYAYCSDLGVPMFYNDNNMFIYGIGTGTYDGGFTALIGAEGITVNKGETETVTVKIIGENTRYPATYENLSYVIADTTIASLTDNTIIGGVKRGTTEYTVSLISEGNAITKNVPVNVVSSEIDVESITVNNDNAYVFLNETKALDITVLPAEATNKTLTFTSADTSIVEVDANGVVTGKALGTTTIEIAAADESGVTATATVTVVKLDMPDEITLTVGEIQSHPAMLTDGTNTIPVNATYQSSDSSILQTASDGRICGVGVGDAYYIVTLTEYSEVDPVQIPVHVINPATGADISQIVIDSYTLRFNDGDYIGYLYNGESNIANFESNPFAEDGDYSYFVYIAAYDITSPSQTTTRVTDAGTQINGYDVDAPYLSVEGGVIGYHDGKAFLLSEEAMGGMEIAVTVLRKTASSENIIPTTQLVITDAAHDIGYFADAEGNPITTSFVAGDTFVIDIDGEELTAVASLDPDTGKVVAPILIDGGYALAVIYYEDDKLMIAGGLMEYDQAMLPDISAALSTATVKKVSLAAYLLNVGDSSDFIVTVLPEGAVYTSAVLSIEDPTVASISDGTVTGLTAGNTNIVATITNTDGSIVTATAPLTVVATNTPVSSISAEDVTVDIGSTAQIDVTVLPDNATDTSVSYASSDPSVATVDENGVVTGVSEGTATITITANDGSGASTTITVTVTDPFVPVSGLEFDAESMVLPVNTIDQLDVTVTPDDASDPQLTFESSNTDVLTVDNNGNIHTLTPGTAVVTVKANDGSGQQDTITITVYDISVDDKLVITKDTDDANVDASIVPADAIPANFTYTSSDETVLTVDGQGNITPVSPGTATITVSDGLVSKTIDVIIVDIDADIPTELYSDDDPYEVTVDVLPDGYTATSVVITSSDPDVIKVNDEGKLECVGVGEATITVTTTIDVDGEPVVVTKTETVTGIVPVTLSSNLTGNNLIIEVGETFQLEISEEPAVNSNTGLTYETASHDFTVSDTGLVTGLNPNYGSIIVTPVYGDPIEIDVVVYQLTYPQNVTLQAGDDMAFSVGVLPNEPALPFESDFTFTVANPEVAKYENGRIYGLTAGTTTITFANNEGITRTVDITIGDVAASYSKLDLVKDETATLTYAPSSADITVTNVSVTSSDPTKVRVDGNNVVGVGNGSATVTAVFTYTLNGKELTATKTFEFTSTVLVEDITLNGIDEPVLMKIGETNDISDNVTVTPDNAQNDDVNYASDNEAVATVDENGVITAVSAGTAVITVSSDDAGDAEETFTVIVVDADMDYSKTDIAAGETATLSYTVAPSGYTVVSITVVPETDGIVLVDDETGNITGLDNGEVEVEVTIVLDYEGKQISFTETFTFNSTVLGTGIAVAAENELLYVGDVKTINASIIPANAANPNLNFVSSDTDVVTVSLTTGEMTAIAPGTADITISSVADPTITKTVHVTVYNVTVTDKLVLKEGETGDIIVTIEPAGAIDNDSVFATSNDAIATVDTNGKVTAIDADNTVITVTVGGRGYTVPVAVYATDIGYDDDATDAVVGDVIDLTADITNGTVTNIEVLENTDPTVVEIDDDGNVTVIGSGETTVTVEITYVVDGEIFTETVTETFTGAVLVGNIDITNNDPIFLNVGDTEDISADVTPANADNKDLDYASSDETVATVDEDGKITATGCGEATITVTAKDGSGKTDTVKVIVYSIDANYDKYTLCVGEQANLTIDIEPSDKLTLKSYLGEAVGENESLLSTAEGNLIAIAPGNVTYKLTLSAETADHEETPAFEKTFVFHVHNPATPVQENAVLETETTPASFELVTYCTDDHAEIDRETVELDTHPAVDPSVNEIGNVKYYTDEDDNKYVYDNGEFRPATDDEIFLPKLPVHTVDEVPATVNEYGVKEHFEDEDGNKYLDENGDGVYEPATDEELRIDKIPVYTVDEVPATVNEYGVQEHFEDEEGNKYLDENNDGIYESATDDDLRIDKLPVHTVDEVPATVNEYGVKEHFEDEDGNKYLDENGDGVYEPATDEELRIDKLPVHTVDEVPATVNEYGVKEHFEDEEGNKYLDEDGDGIYEPATDDDLRIDKLPVHTVDEVPATVNEYGVKEHFEDEDGNKYLDADGDGVFEPATDEELRIDKLPVHTVDEVPATVNEYGVKEHFEDEDGNKYLDADGDGVYEPATDEELRIDKLPVHSVDEVPATVNEYGVKEHFEDEDGNKYLDADNDGIYEPATDEELRIDKIAVENVPQRDPTVNEYGEKEHFEDSDGNKYLIDDETGLYRPATDEELRIDKLPVTPVEGSPATVNEEGIKDHFVDEDGNKYLDEDGDGIYEPATDEDLIIPRIPLTPVDAKDATPTEDGYDAHFIDPDGNKYVYNDETGLYEPAGDITRHYHGDGVYENITVAPTCVDTGLGDYVVYCPNCGKELERQHDVIVPATGIHTPGAAQKENIVPATCTSNGGYDLVVRCTVCGTIISSKHVETDKTPHTWGPDTITSGQYDRYTTGYHTCTFCGAREEFRYGNPNYQFRCSRCDWWDSVKDTGGILGAIYWMIHSLTHMVQSIGHLS